MNDSLDYPLFVPIFLKKNSLRRPFFFLLLRAFLLTFRMLYGTTNACIYLLGTPELVDSELGVTVVGTDPLFSPTHTQHTSFICSTFADDAQQQHLCVRFPSSNFHVRACADAFNMPLPFFRPQPTQALFLNGLCK